MAEAKSIESYQEAYAWCINQLSKQHDRLQAAARALVEEAWGFHIDPNGPQTPCVHVDAALIEALRQAMEQADGQ